MNIFKRIGWLVICFLALSVVALQAQTVPYTATILNRVDKIAGPASMSALVAPDGTKYAYINPRDFCIFSLEEEELGCVNIEVVRGLDVKSVRWSPDSRYLAFTEDFLRRFVDSDIWLVDTEELSLVNLTNDFVDRLEISDAAWGGNQDFSPIWLADGRLAFFRLNRTDGEFTNTIYTMNVEGVEQEPLSFRASFSGVSNYVLAAASDAMVLAYNTDTNMSDGISAANILNFDDETDTFVLPLADKSESPYELQLSYDGSYLLMVGRRSKIVNNVLNSREVMSFVRTDQVSTETNLLNGEHTVVGAAFAPDSNAIAYITRDEENPETQGLYIASAPGEEGQLVLEGMFISPVNASYLFYWAEGGIILLSDFEVNELVTVKVEKAGAVSGA